MSGGTQPDGRADEEETMNGINANGCSYIVMSDRTGNNFRNSNLGGNHSQFFCKKGATTTVEQYPVEVVPGHFGANKIYVEAVWQKHDVQMCDKHAALVAKRRAARAKAVR
jgi:hypothetical protein